MHYDGRAPAARGAGLVCPGHDMTLLILPKQNERYREIAFLRDRAAVDRDRRVSLLVGEHSTAVSLVRFSPCVYLKQSQNYRTKTIFT